MWERANKLGYVKKGESRGAYMERAKNWGKPKTEQMDLSEKWSPEKADDKGDGNSTVDKKSALDADGGSAVKTEPFESEVPEGLPIKPAEAIPVNSKSNRTVSTVDGTPDQLAQGPSALQKDNLKLNNQAVNQMA